MVVLGLREYHLSVLEIMAIFGFRLDWQQAGIIAAERNASRLGIDDTMAACVPIAKRETPVVTATAQGSIGFEPAQVLGQRVVGRWGSRGVNYFIFIEVGARGLPGKFPLRRAADQEYPKLPERIKARFL